MSKDSEDGLVRRLREIDQMRRQAEARRRIEAKRGQIDFDLAFARLRSPSYRIDVDPDFLQSIIDSRPEDDD